MYNLYKSAAMSFRFLEPGNLTDGELELVLASEAWFENLLASVRDPRCKGDSNADATTRQSLKDFAVIAPGGLQPADEKRGIVPAYHFLMRLVPAHHSPLAIVGGMGLRVGTSSDLELYLGHIGYHVFPPARGRHLAERACRLVLPLAARHGMRTLWITCNPENGPSRRTIERLGASYVNTVDLPSTHILYKRGERQKRRYRLEVGRFGITNDETRMTNQ
jgi:tagatose 1,6-diphosphate aldolase